LSNDVIPENRNALRLSAVSKIVNKLPWFSGTVMAQEYEPGEIVPQSGIYTITHDPQHADMPHEVMAIKGRRFPTCRHCKGITFELAHAAKHVGEIEHPPDKQPMPPSWLAA
jgi:hypothetical protein